MFNDIRVVYLGLDYHLENPLYLKMKLSFFTKRTLESKQSENARFYVLLHYNKESTNEFNFFGEDTEDEKSVLDSPDMIGFT